MDQTITRQVDQYYKYSPALHSRVPKEKMDMERLFADLLRTWPELGQQEVFNVGAVMILESGRLRHSILLSLFEIDRSSVSSRFDTTSETTLVNQPVDEIPSSEPFSEETRIIEENVSEEHPVPLRMSGIVDKLIKDDEIFGEMDRAKMMETLSTLMENPPPDLMSITDDELTRRIRKVMLVEVMSGMLKDLSPAQMESFDEAVERRKFFR